MEFGKERVSLILVFNCYDALNLFLSTDHLGILGLVLDTCATTQAKLFLASPSQLFTFAVHII